MPVVNVPGFWDYLSEGYKRGEQNAFAEQDRQDRLKQQEVQNNLQALRLAQESGSVEDMKRIAKLIPSLQGVNFTESPRQLQARILAAPEGDGIAAQAIDTGGGLGSQLYLPSVKGKSKYSDEERKVAGLPTALDKKREGVESKTLDLTGKQADVAIGNVEQDAQLDRMKKLEPVLQAAAERFVSGPILQAGGNINPKQLPALAEQAYNNFLADSQQKGYGNLTPEDAQQAKAYFDKAVRDAYNDQLDRQIKKLAALPASAFDKQFNPATMVNALNGLAKTKGDQLEDLFKQNPLLSVLQNIPPERRTPDQQKTIAEVERLKQEASILQAASAGFAAGTVPIEQAQQLLRQFTAGVTGQAGADATPPPAGTKQPLSPADKQKAATNGRFRAWLQSRGYTEADWK